MGSDATVVRVETDADGNAAYEAHMLKADGSPITVYVDKYFAVVSVENGPAGGPDGGHGGAPGDARAPGGTVGSTLNSPTTDITGTGLN